MLKINVNVHDTLRCAAPDHVDTQVLGLLASWSWLKSLTDQHRQPWVFGEARVVGVARAAPEARAFRGVHHPRMHAFAAQSDRLLPMAAGAGATNCPGLAKRARATTDTDLNELAAHSQAGLDCVLTYDAETD
jgi:hypothetical protein